MKLIDDANSLPWSRFRPEDRNRCEQLWANYEPLADAHFKGEIVKRFHPRFWEMYLGTTLIDLGMQPSRGEASKQLGGPDFRIESNGRSIWIEAIAPERGTGEDAVPDYPADGKVRSVPDDEIILRIRAGMVDKLRKAEFYRNAGVIGAADAFVIAISGGALPNVWNEMMLSRLVHAVWPIGHLTVTVNTKTFAFVDSGYTHRNVIRKKSGSEVSTDAFHDALYAPISAVLYSRADVCNFPTSQLGADFVLCHNPLAANPLQRGWMRVGVEYWEEDSQLHSHDWNRD